MGDNQLGSVKEVLEQDSHDIAEVVQRVNMVRRDLAV